VSPSFSIRIGEEEALERISEYGYIIDKEKISDFLDAVANLITEDTLFSGPVDKLVTDALFTVAPDYFVHTGHDMEPLSRDTLTVDQLTQDERQGIVGFISENIALIETRELKSATDTVINPDGTINVSAGGICYHGDRYTVGFWCNCGHEERCEDVNGCIIIHVMEKHGDELSLLKSSLDEKTGGAE